MSVILTKTYFCFFCTESNLTKEDLYPFVSKTLCEFLICKNCVKEFQDGFEEWAAPSPDSTPLTSFVAIPDFDLKEPASVHKAAMTIQPDGFRLFSPWNYKIGARDALLILYSKLTEEEST